VLGLGVLAVPAFIVSSTRMNSSLIPSFCASSAPCVSCVESRKGSGGWLNSPRSTEVLNSSSSEEEEIGVGGRGACKHPEAQRLRIQVCSNVSTR